MVAAGARCTTKTVRGSWSVCALDRVLSALGTRCWVPSAERGRVSCALCYVPACYGQCASGPLACAVCHTPELCTVCYEL